MWSIEEAKRLKSQYEHGWSVTESAEILERSELDIRNKLLAMGLKPIEDGEKPVNVKARKKRQTVNAEIKAKIIQLRSQGYDYKYIGEQTNTSKATVARILQQSGNTNAEHKKAGNNGLAEKYAKLEKHVKSVEEIDEKRRIELKRTAENLANANLEIQMLQNKIKVLESERTKKPKKAADNWSIKELKNVLELLEPLAIDNGADAMTIGEAIGRLKMMISIAYETERRHGF